MIRQFTVISDSREQLPLEFDSPNIESVKIQKLDTGDYTIENLESILCIERKGSLVEFYRNCTQRRFDDELKRMLTYKYRFLVLEFSLSEVQSIPYSLGLSKAQTAMCKVSANYIMSKIAEIQVDYGVNVVFAETRDIVTDVITNIMKKVYELEHRSI